ncbi:BREX-1 system adenine-specific DNA-methyltransferase PglX [Hornefia butyriciproducens]|uniref:BREX-1 system adenine-specific DNA-methyltransferase PglX n=1 Tax=Hornefia butyriciproducens TaxID=2652293 RepID=UPI003F888127
MKNGFFSMITQHSWMFLPSYEELRLELLQNELQSLAHLGTHAFEEISGEVVQTATFVYRKAAITGYETCFKRLVDYPSQHSKEIEFFNGSNDIVCDTNNFRDLPSYIFAYWASANTFKAFREYKTVSDFGDARQGMATGDNNRFVRFWYEPYFEMIGLGYSSYEEFELSGKRYVPYTKSAGLCRWYGNYYNVLKFDKHNYELLSHSGNCLPSRQYYFRKNANWSLISTGRFAARYSPKGSVFDVGAHAFYNDKNVLKMLGYLNSTVFEHFIKFLSPTMNYNSGIVAKVPTLPIPDNVEKIVEKNIHLSKSDWDSFETSWDFQKHPLIRNIRTIKEAFTEWQTECDNRFNQLKANEEELNRIFIDIYGLQDELIPEEEDKDVTVRKADLSRDICSFISYAVGCMMGRYSLDVDGLAYAGGDWDSSKYKTFIPDKDAIIPITDDEYFTDDIVGRFVEFVRTVYGADTLEENLQFIADALDEKGSTSREVIRNYFLKDFYKDHCKTYQKRPIYWLFDSGKKNGFKCLIYMHRYQPDTIARIRTDYVHEQQARYRTAISGLERQINGAPTSERVRLNKLMTKLKDQAEETRLYEEKIHHIADQMIEIDLDDGVKHNYAIFQDVLAKIR